MHTYMICWGGKYYFTKARSRSHAYFNLKMRFEKKPEAKDKGYSPHPYQKGGKYYKEEQCG